MAPVGTLGNVKAQGIALLNQSQRDNEQVLIHLYIIWRSLVKLKHFFKAPKQL